METTVDLKAVEQQQRIGWQTGNYARVGNTLQIIAGLLVKAVDIQAGQAVLDVACGQGNAAIAAALRFADAIGVDDAPNLLEQGRQRAAPRRHVHGGRRRGSALRGRVLRCRPQHRGCHVRARPAAGGERAVSSSAGTWRS